MTESCGSTIFRFFSEPRFFDWLSHPWGLPASRADGENPNPGEALLIMVRLTLHCDRIPRLKGVISRRISFELPNLSRNVFDSRSQKTSSKGKSSFE